MNKRILERCKQPSKHRDMKQFWPLFMYRYCHCGEVEMFVAFLLKFLHSFVFYIKAKSAAAMEVSIWISMSMFHQTMKNGAGFHIFI